MFIKGDTVLICPDGDQVTYFDNIGKYISKLYRVLSQKYIQSNINTATLNIKLREQQLQKTETLKSGNCRLMKSMH